MIGGFGLRYHLELVVGRDLGAVLVPLDGLGRALHLRSGFKDQRSKSKDQRLKITNLGGELDRLALGDVHVLEAVEHLYYNLLEIRN